MTAESLGQKPGLNTALKSLPGLPPVPNVSQPPKTAPPAGDEAFKYRGL